MNDEEYLFHEDSREKKRIGASAYKRRTHGGKSGRVVLPSDYLSAKERNAMNGEVKSYNINNPMKWSQFKQLPDDLKIMYIKQLRERYDTQDKMVAEMLGCSECTFRNEVKRLGVSRGPGSGATLHPDFDGWHKWLHGIREPKKEPERPEIAPSEPVKSVEACMEELKQTPILPDVRPIFLPMVPQNGSVTFCGNAIDALGTLERLLNGANVRLNVSWEIIPEDGEGRASDDAM